MKKQSKLISMFLAIALIFSLSVPALAVDDYSVKREAIIEQITTKEDAFNANHPNTYKLYGATTTLEDGTVVIITQGLNFITELQQISADKLYTIISAQNVQIEGKYYIYRVAVPASAEAVKAYNEIASLKSQLSNLQDQDNEDYYDEIVKILPIVESLKKNLNTADYILQIGTEVIVHKTPVLDADGIGWDYTFIDADNYNVSPVIKNSTTMIPVRAIVEAFGGTVGYDANTRTVTCTYNSTVVKMVLDKSTATVNGVETKITEPATIINNRTMIPLRFLSEAFNAKVEWTGIDNTIRVWKPQSSTHVSNPNTINPFVNPESNENSELLRVYDPVLDYWYEYDPSMTVYADVGSMLGYNDFQIRVFKTQDVSFTMYCFDEVDRIAGMEYNKIEGLGVNDFSYENLIMMWEDANHNALMIPFVLLDPETNQTVSHMILKVESNVGFGETVQFAVNKFCIDTINRFAHTDGPVG